MKYSFMTFSCPDLTLREVLQLANKLGYDGVEPRISAQHKHGLEIETDKKARAEARRVVADSGVVLSCIATSHRYSDPAHSQAEAEATVRSAELAADLGAPCLRVFGGDMPEGIQRPEAIDRLVSALSFVAEKTKHLPVTICVETHDAWCDPSHVAEVMRRVARPNIAVNWDIMHPVRVAKVSIADSFAALKPWIRHVHFHDGITEPDGKLRMVPIGQGPIDHRKALQLLKAANYAGHLSGEWIRWEPFEVHLPRELATMKRLEQEGA